MKEREAEGYANYLGYCEIDETNYSTLCCWENRFYMLLLGCSQEQCCQSIGLTGTVDSAIPDRGQCLTAEMRVTRKI